MAPAFRRTGLCQRPVSSGDRVAGRERDGEKRGRSVEMVLPRGGAKIWELRSTTSATRDVDVAGATCRSPETRGRIQAQDRVGEVTGGPTWRRAPPPGAASADPRRSRR